MDTNQECNACSGHETMIDVLRQKQNSICKDVTRAHIRLDGTVPMTTFQWAIGILVTIGIIVFGFNYRVQSNNFEMLVNIDKGVAVLAEKVHVVEERYEIKTLPK